MIALVNSERAANGCGVALVSEPRLTTAARGHAEDMAANDYFSHESLDGRTFDVRITNTGYRWSAIAENIAMGQDTAEEVMRGWMNSSGHRTNILNCAYRQIGVGIATNTKGQKYWVQDFAAPA